VVGLLVALLLSLSIGSSLLAAIKIIKQASMPARRCLRSWGVMPLVRGDSDFRFEHFAPSWLCR